jgi:hypothetical protein
VRDLRDLEYDAFLAQAETLAQLQAFPAWEAWTALLRDMRTATVEELVAAKDPGEIRFLQGAASALGEILERPSRIVASAASFIEAEQQDKGAIRPELRAVVGMGLDEGGDV